MENTTNITNKPTNKTVKAKVKRVLDGDTFETDAGEMIKLNNVYAPGNGKDGAEAATQKLRSLINKENVTIIKIGTSDDITVANVKHDDKSVNKKMKDFLKRKK